MSEPKPTYTTSDEARIDALEWLDFLISEDGIAIGAIDALKMCVDVLNNAPPHDTVDFAMIASSRLAIISGLERERDEISAALGLDLPSYQEWGVRMIDGGWYPQIKGWMHNSGVGALTTEEAGAFFIADETPPPPAWDTLAPPNIPDMSEYVKVVTDE